MRRETPSFALLLVGSWILKLALTDDYKMYVKDSFGPFLVAAGALLVIAAITGLVMTMRGASVDHADHSENTDVDDDHGHEHRSYVGWLLLAPLLAFTLIAPRPLGAYSVEQAAGPPPPPASQKFDPLPAGDPVSLTMRDFTSRSLWGQGKTLEGRTVKLVGFVTPRPSGGYYVTRLVIACCAADALPVQVYVSGNAPDFASNAWVAVEGTATKPVRDETDSFDVAAIDAKSVTPTPAPDSPYEQ